MYSQLMREIRAHLLMELPALAMVRYLSPQSVTGSCEDPIFPKPCLHVMTETMAKVDKNGMLNASITTLLLVDCPSHGPLEMATMAAEVELALRRFSSPVFRVLVVGSAMPPPFSWDFLTHFSVKVVFSAYCVPPNLTKVATLNRALAYDLNFARWQDDKAYDLEDWC